uniref:RxLR effector candidate protein n=1 Tax=Hyaloperonospora arabidopsidis (strain Emoy2) TaxID=559515 RepID=M4B1I5_HYAAE
MLLLLLWPLLMLLLLVLASNSLHLVRYSYLSIYTDEIDYRESTLYVCHFVLRKLCFIGLFWIILIDIVKM